MRLFAFISFACISFTGVVSAQEAKVPAAFEFTSLRIYNDIDVFADRSPPAVVISSFVLEIEKIAKEYWKSQKPELGKTGIIAIAIRPNRTMKIWVDVDQEFRSEASEYLELHSKSLGVPECTAGPIAFAMNFDLWGGSGKDPITSIIIPKVWTDAAKGIGRSLKVPDDVLPLVWNEGKTEPATSFAPEGYVWKDLNPVSGRILIPENWFFLEDHRDHVFMWSVTKQNAKVRPYETGAIIQLIYGSKQATGQSAAEIIRNIFEGKKRTAKSFKEIPPKSIGPLTHVGLEIIEMQGKDNRSTNLRVNYRCYWSNEDDFGVVLFYSTTEDQWDKFEKTFDTLSGFKIIDFEKLNFIAPKVEKQALQQ